MTSDPQAPDDRQRWRRYLLGHPVPAGVCPGPVDLAAYVDRRLRRRRRDAVETHLAACPDCLAAVREAVALRDLSPPPASGEVTEAARALVTRSVRESPPPPLSPGTIFWRSAGRWGLAAAAALVVATTGFRLGIGVSSPSDPGPGDLIAEMSFGVLSADVGDDALDPLVTLYLEELR